MFYLSFLISLVASQIIVYSPQSLRKSYPDGITGSLGNFGNPPYDSSINGYVWFAAPSNGCEPITDTNINAEVVNLIVFFYRGDCAFVLKVKHAQDRGAKAVVIINNIPGQDVTKITMKDNGLGGNLYIPAFLISDIDGAAVKKSIEDGETVSLVLKFEQVTLADLIYLDLWISSANDLSQSFLKNFASIGKQLTKKNAEFHPHYVFIKCLNCEKNNFQESHDDCLGGGRYCAPDPDGPGPIKGRDVVIENLRQICMFNQLSESKDYSIWFKFQEEFSNNCESKIFNDDCSNEIMKKLGLNTSEVKKCYNKSFAKGYEDYLSENTILREEMVDWHSNGLHYFPALIINGQLYRGDLENSAVKLALCAGYQIKYQPEFCKEIVDEEVTEEGFSTQTVIIALAVFFIAVAVVLLVYRHFAKQELQKEMRMQVNSAVSQYFALSDTSTFKNADRQAVKASYV